MKLPSQILPGPSYDVEKHLAHVQKLFDAYPYRDSAACIAKVRVLAKDAPAPLRAPVENFLADLLEDNDIFLTDRPTLQFEPYLSRMQRRFTINTARAFTAAADILAPLYRAAPSDTSVFKVPLSDAFDAHDLIAHAWRLYDLKDGDEFLFPDLRRQLFENIIVASGLDPKTYDGKRKLTYPGDSTLPKDRKLAAYLAKTPFLELFGAEIPFAIPDRLFTQHTAILGKTGHGKTQLIQTLIVDQLQRPDPPGMFVIDNMGTMLKKIEQLALFNTTLRDRLVIIDPAETPALNLFHFRASNSLYFYLFKAIDQSLTPRQATMISYLMTLMQATPGATLDTLRQVCEGKVKPDLGNLDAITRDFFENQFYGRDALITQTKSQIAQRLYTIARMGTFNAMLSASENKFDPLRCMQERKVVLISTDTEHLDEASPVFGRFLIAQIMAAARRRPQNDRKLALLIIDEAKAYFDEKTEEILADARQFGLGLIFATQHVEQLPEGVRKAMYGNTSIKFVGEVGYGDAVALSREMNTTAEHLKGLVGLDYGRPAQWATYASGVTPAAVTLAVPYGTLEALPKMDDAAHGALRRANREHFTATVSRTVNEEELIATPQKKEEPRDAKTSKMVYDTDI